MASYESCSKIIQFDQLEDPTSKYTLEKQIATGTYGEVHEATENESKCKY